MATIEEKICKKTIISFKFKAFLGRDENGKQIFKTTTWYPPSGLTNAKSRKEAEREAIQWEAQVKEEYRLEQERQASAWEEEEPERDYTFDEFVNEVWLPLCVSDGFHRPATITMYQSILKVMLPKFKGIPLQKVTGIRVMKYLSWLRNDYRTNRGKPLADKSIRHHYNILRMIFNFAEKQEVIEKNPMKKVDAPKVSKKSVDALTEEDASRFFEELKNCPLDFRCIMYILITTGLRRGECLGLQWQDIDFQKETISVKRSATYTKMSGLIVAEPKTATSVRTIPVMKTTLILLKELLRQREQRYPFTVLSGSFVFCREGKPFEPRNPDAVTRHLKRFVKANGLPDVSPHDLRHTCASLLLSSGADIKSVQEILGHADASTTLNFYVKADLRQMRTATEKYAQAFNL